MGGRSFPFASRMGVENDRPVRNEAARLRNMERHRITRDTRAGRECHVSIMVPKVRMMRRGVRTWTLGTVSKTQNGVSIKMRIKSVVNAGRVVAEVGVRCVERKSVRRRKGSRRRLQRVVNSRRVSTISSRDLWCFNVDSEASRLWPLGSCFSPVVDVEERGEYRREYMPRMSSTTTMIGPAYLKISPPYRAMPQNAATSKKDSQGSLVLHESRPASLFSGSRNGCE